MQNEIHFICGVSGEPINVGDQYIVETVQPEHEGQSSYERLVKVEHAGFSEEEISQKTEDGSIKTRTE